MKLFRSWSNTPQQPEIKDLGNGNTFIITEKYGIIQVATELKMTNAFELASQVSEIFFPVDAVANRAASVKASVQNDKGEIVEPSPRLKEFLKQPNPFETFSDLVYNLVFAEFSDGNSYLYTKASDIFKDPTIDQISGIYSLRPDHVDIAYKKFNYFNATSKSDLINYYKFNETGDKLNPDFIIHSRAYSNTRSKDDFKSVPPLWSAKKAIDNLLAVYSARYNVYVNNGMAGILTKKAEKLDEVSSIDPVTREKILNDLEKRFGIVGNKHLKGITSIPVEYINMLATIKDLEPFEETLADALQIASVLGIDKDLVPHKAGTTYDNKLIAERGLWQNVIKGVCYDVYDDITKALRLKGQKLVPDFSDIDSLAEDKVKSVEADMKTIELLKGIKDLYGEQGQKMFDEIIKKILLRYETK